MIVASMCDVTACSFPFSLFMAIILFQDNKFVTYTCTAASVAAPVSRRDVYRYRNIILRCPGDP